MGRAEGQSSRRTCLKHNGRTPWRAPEGAGDPDGSTCMAVASGRQRHRGLSRGGAAATASTDGRRALDVSRELSAFLDHHLAIADLARDAPRGMDHKLLPNSQATLEVAMDLGDIDLG